MNRTDSFLAPSDLMDLNTLSVTIHKSRSWIYMAMKDLGLPAHRLGKRWTFSRAEVDEWFRALPGVNLPIAG